MLLIIGDLTTDIFLPEDLSKFNSGALGDEKYGQHPFEGAFT